MVINHLQGERGRGERGRGERGREGRRRRGGEREGEREGGKVKVGGEREKRRKGGRGSEQEGMAEGREKGEMVKSYMYIPWVQLKCTQHYKMLSHSLTCSNFAFCSSSFFLSTWRSWYSVDSCT